MGLFLFECCYCPQVDIICPGTYIEEIHPSSIPLVWVARHLSGTKKPNNPLRLSDESGSFPRKSHLETELFFTKGEFSIGRGATALLPRLAPYIQLLVGILKGAESIVIPDPTRQETP